MKKIELFMHQLKSNFNKENIQIMLPLILEEIYKLLERIYECNTEKQAQIYFDELWEIQELLSGIAFKHGLSLPQELKKIVRDCERLDDKDVRHFLFNEIKNDTYSLKSDKFLWY
jgi:hypothetical protein